MSRPTVCAAAGRSPSFSGVVSMRFGEVKKGQPKRTNLEIRRVIADRLKKLRTGQSQEKVIEPTKLNLSQYEALLRTPSLDSIYILCEYFGITLREFFDVEDFDIPSKK